MVLVQKWIWFIYKLDILKHEILTIETLCYILNEVELSSQDVVGSILAMR